MSYESTMLAFDLLNRQLGQLYRAGEPINLTVQGKPELHILSFDPFAYETYGTFRNRAPYVAGVLALRGFLTQRHGYSNGAIVYAGVESGNQAYGFVMDGHNPQSREVINGIALRLGYPQLQLEK